MTGPRDTFDLVAIGSGSAAFAAAIRASKRGARVALVERATVGGTCVNRGCIPSKALLAAADSYRQAGTYSFKGVQTFRGGVDLPSVMAAKEEIVGGLRTRKYVDLLDDYGFSLIRGTARFASPDEISVDGRIVHGERFVIATGAVPSIPAIDGLREAGFLTSTSAMELSALPDSLVVLGGGYVGLEMAQMFAGLGVHVTIVEALDRIAANEEPEVSQWLTDALRADGIDVWTSVRVRRVTRRAAVTTLELDGDLGAIKASALLVATGRRPALADLDLARGGIERDRDGMIVLDSRLKTTNPRVYAAGDATGGPQFVYVAAAQGAAAADNALTCANAKVDFTALPRVTFTTPNVASAGLTEREALAAGFDCECRVLPMTEVPRAIVGRSTAGGLKMVAERGSGRLLGVHAVGANVSEVVLPAVYAIQARMPVHDVARSWAPYLTMSEGLKLVAQTFTTDVSRLSCCAG